jgi:hypothetical protein
MTDAPTAEALVRAAQACADAARPETLRHFRRGVAADDKAGGARFDPVTEADRAAERAMRATLARLRPETRSWARSMGPRPAPRASPGSSTPSMARAASSRGRPPGASSSRWRTP